jgi:hypothetical protein
MTTFLEIIKSDVGILGHFPTPMPRAALIDYGR